MIRSVLSRGSFEIYDVTALHTTQNYNGRAKTYSNWKFNSYVFDFGGAIDAVFGICKKHALRTLRLPTL